MPDVSAVTADLVVTSHPRTRTFAVCSTEVKRALNRKRSAPPRRVVAATALAAERRRTISLPSSTHHSQPAAVHNSVRKRCTVPHWLTCAYLYLSSSALMSLVSPASRAICRMMSVADLFLWVLMSVRWASWYDLSYASTISSLRPQSNSSPTLATTPLNSVETGPVSDTTSIARAPPTVNLAAISSVSSSRS